MSPDCLRAAHPECSTAQIVEEARDRWMSSTESASFMAEAGYSASELRGKRFA